jgi:hypothetical protein
MTPYSAIDMILQDKNALLYSSWVDIMDLTACIHARVYPSFVEVHYYVRLK